MRDLQCDHEPITMPAWRVKRCGDLRRGHTPGEMKYFKWRADLIKEGLDAIVDHLKHARIENDPCWITMAEQHFLMKLELHGLTLQKA